MALRCHALGRSTSWDAPARKTLSTNSSFVPLEKVLLIDIRCSAARMGSARGRSTLLDRGAHGRTLRAVHHRRSARRDHERSPRAQRFSVHRALAENIKTTTAQTDKKSIIHSPCASDGDVAEPLCTTERAGITLRDSAYAVVLGLNIRPKCHRPNPWRSAVLRG